MVRLARLSRNGNSTALTIPRAVLRSLGWHRGELLACAVASGQLVARRVDETELMRAGRDGDATMPRRRRSK